MTNTRVYLSFVLLFVLTVSFDSRPTKEIFNKCSLDLTHDQSSISVMQPLQQSSRRRRSLYQLRIHSHFDESFNMQQYAYLYKEYIVKPAIEYLESALRVRNHYPIIKLQRKCISNRLGFMRVKRTFMSFCADGCAAKTTCGDVEVPDDHLLACRKLLGSEPVSVGYEGSGVVDKDFILYIESRHTRKCSDSSVLAYASSCQSESQLDRPIAGSINFCPGRLSSEFGQLSQSLYIAKHELFHALGFAITQFAFYRDKDGVPYTPRNRLTGRPGLGFYTDRTNIYQWSDKVTRNTIRRWQSAVGLFFKNVTTMILPTVVMEARRYFNCSTLEGMDLEDQGGLGVSITHWEKRILENEIMTATFTQESRVSRITLALMEDTGWYIPNYEMADTMFWGRGLGCDFTTMSCYEYMRFMEERAQSIQPYCTAINRPDKELAGYCSADKHAYAYCNLEKHPYRLEPQYRYFTESEIYQSAYYGGRSSVANYCPYPQEFNWYKGNKVSRTTQCKEKLNKQTNHKNFLLQDFSSMSSCFSLSRKWSVYECGTKKTPDIIGAGCYKFVCDDLFGLVVIVNNHTYQCPSAGDIVAIEDFNEHFSISGALVCPSCSDYCPNTHCSDNARLLPFSRSYSDSKRSRQHCTSTATFRSEIILSCYFSVIFIFITSWSLRC